MGLAIPPVDACRTAGYSDVPSPFSMDDATFRVLGYRLVDTLAAYLDKLPQEPVYRPLPVEVRLELEKMNVPAEGLAARGSHRKLSPARAAIRPRPESSVLFAAFVDPAASKLSMLAAFASAVTNTSGAGGNYAAIYVERCRRPLAHGADRLSPGRKRRGPAWRRIGREPTLPGSGTVLGCPSRRLGHPGGGPLRASPAHHVHVGRRPFLPGEGRLHARTRQPRAR